MKGADTYYSTVSLCMPMVLLVSAFLDKFLYGINPDMALTVGSLLVVMTAEACTGIICGIAGFVKKETMKWLSVAGTLENACIGLACCAILAAL
ncbi:MAG: hypothetical protein WAX69_11935 [Victivallales bacterium]